MASIAVVGTGYVGLTAAVCFAHLGHDVIGAEIDERKVGLLRSGRCPIEELGLERMLLDELRRARIRFETDVPSACASADVVFLCLPTPPRADGGADLRILHQAVHSVREALRPGAVVVTKSTVPVGTADEVARLIGRADVSVVSNPEFLREGTAVEDFLEPDRIVVGSWDPVAIDVVADLYAALDAPVLRMDPPSAELLKYAANAMLALRLSFVNELADICDHSGADIDAVIDGLGRDRRIGSQHLRPGPGWGGSCFPKDTLALVRHAQAVGAPASLVEEAVTQNGRWMRRITDEILEHACSSPARRVPRIGVWGLAFKAGTDDIRDSPAVAIVGRLLTAGAEVTVHDPTVAEPPATLPSVQVASTAVEAAREADVVVVATEWPEYTEVDLSKVAEVMAGSVLFDTRASIDAAEAGAAGLSYRRPGKSLAR
jgi:UDPglucose 6-dehydrogenase